jgi:hypothetical protein
VKKEKKIGYTSGALKASGDDDEPADAFGL